MSYSNAKSLVSTDWLAEHITAPDVRTVDATWFMPAANRNPRNEFEAEHIPGSVFFDIDVVVDDSTPLPHTMPSPEKFSSAMRSLGLGDGNRIVVYDNNMGMAAHRLWWMLRVFGHEDVAVLDGGIKKWIAEGHATKDLSDNPGRRHFTAQVNNTLVRYRDQVLQNVDSKREQVIDARPSDRFNGTVPEPRAGLRSGHIPGSFSTPFQHVMDMENFATMRPASEITKFFEDANVDLSKPIITTCGSGVTASCLTFALYLIGKEDVSVYDGSWSEWGGDETCPIEI